MSGRKKALRTIGIFDEIDLPEAGIYGLPCKIDTGADTSSIHCDLIRIKVVKGEEFLSFRLLDKGHPQYHGKQILTQSFKEKKVKNSFGDYEYRYQVKLPMMLFGELFNVFFNLSDRSRMKYPVLLGRRFLKNRFLVDVSKKNLSAQYLKSMQKEEKNKNKAEMERTDQ